MGDMYVCMYVRIYIYTYIYILHNIYATYDTVFSRTCTLVFSNVFFRAVRDVIEKKGKLPEQHVSIILRQVLQVMARPSFSYVCVCVCVCVRACVCARARVHITYVFTNIHACIHTYNTNPFQLCLRSTCMSSTLSASLSASFL